MFRRPAWFAADDAPPPFAALAVGILMAVLATVIRAGCDPVLGPQAPFLLHIPAVVVASWFGGLPAGAAAAIPSANRPPVCCPAITPLLGKDPAAGPRQAGPIVGGARPLVDAYQNGAVQSPASCPERSLPRAC